MRELDPGRARDREPPPGRDRRGDGRGPRPHGALAEHQGAARLLVRACSTPRGGLVAQAAHIPVHLGVDAALGARRDRARAAGARRRRRAERSVRRRHAPARRDGGRAGVRARRAAAVRATSPTARTTPTSAACRRARCRSRARSTRKGLRLPPVQLVARRPRRSTTCSRSSSPTRACRRERDGDLARAVGGAAGRAPSGCARWRGASAASPAGARDGGAAGLLGARSCARRCARCPRGTYRAHDVLDDDGLGAARPAASRVDDHDRAAAAPAIDFTGTAPQTRGPVNANLAVTRSAVLYVFAALAGEAIPPNDGLARPLDIVAPEGSLVNALAAGGGGGRQRRDLAAHRRRAAARARACGARPHSGRELRLDEQRRARRHRRRPARSRTTRRSPAARAAGPSGPGASAMHTHMTNTMNTPIEALEAYYPLRVRRYALRPRVGRARPPPRRRRA